MSNTLANLFAKLFIARPDVKAIQRPDGSWAPHTAVGTRDTYLPWKRADLIAHLSGEATYGHYLLSSDSKCKLFAFDIDLVGNREPSSNDPGHQGYWVSDDGAIHPYDARLDWADRRHPGRNWTKYQLRMAAHMLAAQITEELELPCAVAYSGAKGLHVYGFTGEMSATDAREGAEIVLDSLKDRWEPQKGKSFYRSVDRDPVTGFPNLSVEVFPKQVSLGNGGFGNLMRLPLGRNLKSSDPTFFVDLTAPMGQLVPVDAEWALTELNPWKSPND